MSKFCSSFVDISRYQNSKHKPDFNNLLKVLNHSKPDRPTLFEFFLNNELYEGLTGDKIEAHEDAVSHYRVIMKAFKNAGYDYMTLHGSDFKFPSNRQKIDSKTISLNQGAVITDQESYNNYVWPDADDFDYSRLDILGSEMPEGMRLIVHGPGGVLENVIQLTGYDTLCYLIADDPDLAQKIFDQVGSRLLKYYKICAPHKSVGALISNDDWGFNTQTMLSIENMRRYVFPWHREIVKTIHKSGKPAILHSCGQLEKVMDDIIDDMKYDAKHSYEDNILPVEDAYERWVSRIAIFGGIDVDFICRSAPEEVFERSVNMLKRTMDRGGYALGSGNSIPYYVPNTNYLAMISAINGV